MIFDYFVMEILGYFYWGFFLEKIVFRVSNGEFEI